MKLALLSDLHLEFGPMSDGYEVPADADVILLAGDIGTGIQGVRWATHTFAPKPVVYVAGNHEFYKSGWYFSKGYRKMKEAAAGTSVHVLQNEAVVIDGVRFVGTTLWTDMKLYGDPYLAAIRAIPDNSGNGMNDYKFIQSEPPSSMDWSNRPLKPIETIRAHATAMDFLMDELYKEHDGPTVVVTHHAPSEQSCLPEFAGCQANEFYASNLDRFADMCEAVLWVHGHIHQSKDYMLGETRVAVNPRGYVGDTLNPNFDPKLILEV